MADQTSESTKKTGQEEDVIGKAYDNRLMRRLLTYLWPYKWQAAISLAAILLKAGCDVLGPFLTKIAIDRYMTAQPEVHLSALVRRLSPNPVKGITQIAGIY